MSDFGELFLYVLICIIIVFILVFGIYGLFTKANIDKGPYICIDVDNNTIICEQVWISYGFIYGITEDGKTISLKSYESVGE